MQPLAVSARLLKLKDVSLCSPAEIYSALIIPRRQPSIRL